MIPDYEGNCRVVEFHDSMLKVVMDRASKWLEEKHSKGYENWFFVTNVLIAYDGELGWSINIFLDDGEEK